MTPTGTSIAIGQTMGCHQSIYGILAWSIRISVFTVFYFAYSNSRGILIADTYWGHFFWSAKDLFGDCHSRQCLGWMFPCRSCISLSFLLNVAKFQLSCFPLHLFFVRLSTGVGGDVHARIWNYAAHLDLNNLFSESSCTVILSFYWIHLHHDDPAVEDSSSKIWVYCSVSSVMWLQ